MTDDHDLERAVRGWVALGSERLPDPALDAALQQIAMTPQRRAAWLARMVPSMNGNVLRFGVAAVAITAAAVIGLQFIPGNVGAPTPPSTPTPTPVTLASGSFTAAFGAEVAIDIDATASEANVSGGMDVSDDSGQFSVDLKCTRTADNEVILIGGDVTDSTHDAAAEGSRVAIALQPGTPVKATLWFEEPPPAASCPAFLESVPDEVANNLRPVEGNVQVGP